jgi:hypothetical protein
MEKQKIHRLAGPTGAGPDGKVWGSNLRILDFQEKAALLQGFHGRISSMTIPL